MRHLTTLLTMAITFTGLAQQMPYNPDANGDDFVGVDDVLGVLGVYDTALMQPDLQCDYEGTDLEQLFGGAIAGSIIVDSIYVEFAFIDSVLTFSPECPDPFFEDVVLTRSYMLEEGVFNYNSNYTYLEWVTDYLGYYKEARLSYDYNNGHFQFSLNDQEVTSVTTFGVSYLNPSSFTLPFAEDWMLTEDGIVAEWRPQDFVTACQSFRLIPFWHEAE